MLRKKLVVALCGTLVGALSMTALLLAVTAADTPVADAAQAGDRETVRSLLRQGADVNAAQGDGMTALHWAAFKDDVETAEMLLYGGANVAATTRVNAMTPLVLASRNGSSPMIEVLIEGGADANLAMTTGTTPLMLAAASGVGEAVKALIDHGADLDAKEGERGQTPLMFAAALNRAEAIDVLIEGGADATIATKVVDVAERNRSARARRGGRGQVAQGQGRGRGGNQQQAAARGRGGRGTPGAGSGAPLLSASGLGSRSGNAGSVRRQQPQARGRFRGGMGERVPPVETMGGLTPLLFAARQGHLQATDSLLAAGVDINEVSPGDNSTPLLIATINGHFDLASHLLDQGADPTIASKAGGTPLYVTVNVKWAPEAGYPQPDTSQEKVTYLDLMEQLLENGADVNAQLKKELWFTGYNFDLSRANATGATTFWRASQVSDVTALRFLVEHGADPSIATKDKIMPLHVATGGGVHGNDEVTAPGGWMPAVRYLVNELGADVNVKDSRGMTPLHNAAAIGHNEMVQFLFDHGADPTALGNNGETVADMANGPRQRIQPFLETIALLLKMGSPFNDNCVSC